MKTAALIKCLAEWNCIIEFQCNWNAIGNAQQIREYKDGDIAIQLHQRGNTFFIEERIGNTMYPTVYKVACTGNEVAIIADEEFEAYKQKRGI